MSYSVPLEFYNDTDNKHNDKKSFCDREVQTKDKNEGKEKNVQTDIKDPCVCKEKCNSYRVHFEKDKVICILKIC